MMPDTHYPCGHENRGCAQCYAERREHESARCLCDHGQDVHTENRCLSSLVGSDHLPCGCPGFKARSDVELEDQLAALRKVAAPFVPTYPLPPAEDDEDRRAVGFISFGRFAYVVTAGDLRALAVEMEEVMGATCRHIGCGTWTQRADGLCFVHGTKEENTALQVQLGNARLEVQNARRTLAALRARLVELEAGLRGLSPLLVREGWDPTNPKVRYLRCIDPICGALVTASKMGAVGLRHRVGCRAEQARTLLEGEAGRSRGNDKERPEQAG